jgi:hypothetical protein
MSTSVLAGEWSVVVGFSRTTMEVPLTSDSLLHVSGMLYLEQPFYLSSSAPHELAPDYHHSGCFEAVEIVAYPWKG